MGALIDLDTVRASAETQRIRAGIKAEIARLTGLLDPPERVDLATHFGLASGPVLEVVTSTETGTHAWRLRIAPAEGFATIGQAYDHARNVLPAQLREIAEMLEEPPMPGMES